MARIRYYYLAASFVRSDMPKTVAKTNVTVETDEEYPPVAKVLRRLERDYKDIMSPHSASVDTCIEISKEDYKYLSAHFDNEKETGKKDKEGSQWR
jgi:ABC-type proline/glycine betaine transport system substrate-binding protein